MSENSESVGLAYAWPWSGSAGALREGGIFDDGVLATRVELVEASEAGNDDLDANIAILK